MNTEQERAAFEAWAASIGFCVTGKYAETIDVLCAESAFKAGYRAGRAALQSQEYTAAIGGAGQAYLDRFKNAHALPAEFRWSELWAVMCAAANMSQPGPLQAQEPVAFRVMRKTYDGRWVTDGRGWCDGAPSADLLADIAKRSDGWRIEHAYGAPQPTEPVKVPSDAPAALRFAAQVVELYDDATMVNDYMIDSSDCAGILNALADYFARCGQPAQPAASVGPECWCEACRPITMQDMRMVLCPICGNKRCPHATDHRNACSGSNEPGQPGSSYAHCAAPVAQEPWKPLAAALYQAAGAYDMPVRFLDVLSAAANGEPFAHLMDGLLPVDPPVAQEPVAFLCRECDEEGWSTYAVMPHEVPSTGEFLHVEPLYASPVAAQAQPVVNQQMTTAARDVLAEIERIDRAAARAAKEKS